MKRIIKIIISSLISICILTGGILPVYSADDNGYTVSDEGRLPFEDTDKGRWYSDAAEFCYLNGIINGVNSYTYMPEGRVTRAQFVMMLANLEGVDTSGYEIKVFSDVGQGDWFYHSVAWAYNNGITAGTSKDKFSPNKALDRQSFARMFALYMMSKGYDVKVDTSCLDKYTDRDRVEVWARAGMQYVISAGLISGMSQNTLSPRTTLTRAQASRILMLFVTEYQYSDHRHTYTEPDCTQLSVCTQCGLKLALPKGHRLYGYDCVTNGVCIDCGAEVGVSAYLHDFIPATCSQPRCCVRCFATRGNPTEKHEYIPATCDTPLTCRDCGKTKGEKLGCDGYNSLCSRCGRECFNSTEARVLYYLKTKGNYDPETDSRYVGISHGDSMTILIYYNTEKRFALEHAYYADNGDVFVTELTGLRSYYPYHDLLFTQIRDGEYIFIGETELVGGYSEGKDVKLDIYWSVYDIDYKPILKKALSEMIPDADALIKELCGGSSEDIGLSY
ncbi:MAG: S-layer homology domain-containing protein [Clostridia bacterium]|nr:S-layer homology domain-containing protein [Clostridia bacterium]